MLISRRVLALVCGTALLIACGNGDRSFIPDSGGDGSLDVVQIDGRFDGTVGDSTRDGRMIPDGATVLPDGAVILPDGAVWNPDDAMSMDASMDGAMVDGGDGGPVACAPLADGGTQCATEETCGNGLDDDCNGLVDEGCVCVPGVDHERCYDGCAAQAGIGVCVWGYMNCTGTGEFGMYDGHCIDAGRPQPVVCGGMRDYLCDGIIDEGCQCRVGETRACYSGAAATRNVGACTDGVQHCEPVGSSTGWGPCEGEVLPSAPACDGIDHACDGMPYEACACPPGEVRSCYDGPASTAGVGLCRAGQQSCVLANGSANWGPCVGQVLPAADLCDGIDRLCNGNPDTGCACVPGATRSCYGGPTGTADVGLCHSGRQTCITSGSGTMWGTCEGEVRPSLEVCDGFDHDCDGMPNTGCACTPGTSRSCYTGPSGTDGVGLCHAGSQLCVAGPGGVGASWGTCQGQVLPAANQCDGVDRQCNGMASVGCTCIAGSTRSCYDGPSGTAGVGLCRSGQQTCNATGTGWGACSGQVLPSGDTCDGLDHNCDGTPNTGCACTPGATQSCYGGPAGTVNVGVCRAGTQTCVAGAGGIGSSWGACAGEVVPSTNTCDGVDRACTGMPYAGCLCVPGTTRSCYSGPSGTNGVGLCHGGTQACMSGSSGPFWGTCTGQQLPTPDTCDGLDHTCTGMPYSGCACMPGSSRPCYSGPTGTEGVGVCRAGTQSCVSGTGGVGSSWGTCGGQVLPGAILCDGMDHACDGNYAADCPCMPGATRGCYDGPAGTAGVGTCRAGSQTCVTRTGGGTTWGACSGEVLPAAPTCDGLDHACTGMLPNCNPMLTCPAPITTSVGVGVSLRGTATAIAPATIASYQWTVISAPAGATYAFTSTSTNPTTFTAMAGGVYTVRLTVTDSMGRTSSCSVLVTVTARSYLGTEFYAVTTSNAELTQGTTFQFAIAIGNPNNTAVNVTVTGGALTSATTFSVPANSTRTQTLPWVNGLAHNSGQRVMGNNVYIPATSSLVANGAYRVVTDAPVSAYQFNPLTFATTGGMPNYSYTNDASLLLPTVALTGNYMAMGHQSFGGGGGFVAIVGTSATPTTVNVTLRAAITAGTGVTAAASGSTVSYTLNRGDVVQLISTYTAGTNSYQAQDLTGSVITASQPVAVFGGHDCTQISDVDGACPACDHLEEQLFPTETWGRDVIVSQYRDRSTTEPYTVRVLSRENNNTITFAPASVHAPVTLNRGQSIEICTTGDAEITSTQPMMVGQFMTGQNVLTCGNAAGSCAAASATEGDPSFSLAVPVAQFRRDYNFIVPATYTRNFITVIGTTGSTILLDGAALPATSTPIAGTSWSVWRVAVTGGVAHQINSSAGPFGLQVYGVALYTSYIYPGGLDLQTLP